MKKRVGVGVEALGFVCSNAEVVCTVLVLSASAPIPMDRAVNRPAAQPLFAVYI